MKTQTSLFKTICILSVALFCTIPATAQKVSLSTAQQVAKNYFFLKNTNVAARANVAITNMRVETMDNDTMLYVFNMSPAGFIVLANEQKTQAILGYSTENTAEETNPAFDAWLDNYKRQINYIRKHDEIIASAKNSQEWNVLSSADFSRESYQNNAKMANGGGSGGGMNTMSVSPLLTTTWDQGAGYNYYCPTSGGMQAITGCVATAMAQVMRYHNHPTYGNGSHSYVEAANYNSNNVLTTASYGTLSANFGTTTYDWANMPNSASGASPLVQRQAIGRLMSHAGISVDMDYSPSSSGASTPATADAMADYFHYTNGGYLDRSLYITATWKAILKGGLDASKPIVYRGRNNGPNGYGHAWVCDGYDANDYFHMNWGWSGSSNGYFSVDDLTPGSLYLNDSQGAIINTPRYLTTSKSTMSFCYSASSSSFSISSNATIWTVTDNASWITLSAASGANNGAITVTVAANTGSASRSGTITVKGGGKIRTITVTQSGTPTITAVSTFYPGTYGAWYYMSIASSGNFTVSDNAAWITLLTTTGTAATTSLGFATTANTTGAVRTGIITVTGACGFTKTITISQSYQTNCSSITSVTVTSSSNNSATLNFTASGSPTFYRIYYKTAATTAWHWYGSYAASSVTVGGLNANTSYNFKVEAACSNSTTGAVSATYTKTTLPSPNSKSIEEIENVTATDGLPSEYRTESNLDNAIATWKVFPNPANDILNVTLPSLNEEKAIVTIFDLSGRMMLQETANAAQFEVNVSQIPAGMYILTVKNGNDLHTEKVQVVR